ncbi:hypothetical protein ACH4KN_06630 [Streptomyces sp. NPDC017546]|uniref:hypothetical protein n=1 Tax=unclassified Streptomyces TaxID=2593676 RepID=UPI002361E539|nr:hypothetical protein [Streptomyces sp. MMBL 11-1]
MTCASDTGTGRAPALRAEGEEGPGQAAPLAALLAQACRTVLDGQVGAVGAGLVSAARHLLTSDDDGHPQPVAHMAAAVGPARSALHIALADLLGWPLYNVESARITFQLTIPAPPGPDGVLRPTVAATTATATMTATVHLTTRPGPSPLADDLVAAALTRVPSATDSDRYSAPAQRAVAAWRYLPSLYRRAEQLSAEAPGHPATAEAVRAVEDLAAAVCTWCAGGPTVDPRLVARAPRPDSLGPDAPPALTVLATSVSGLCRVLGTPEDV